VSTKGKVRENSEVYRQRVREKADIMTRTVMMTIPEPSLLTRAKPKEAHEAVVLLKVKAREEVLPQGLAARAKVKEKAKAKAKGADRHQKAEVRVARSHVPSSQKAFALMATSAGIAMMENLPKVMPHLPKPPM
jgi:hypothetical protein